MEKIQIKTGSNISKILQSTVNVPQAFTELVKNSLQNESSFCKIKLNKNSASILDDGNGFDHKEDESGMNGFDKYFVFGNSYDQTQGSGVRLGHMGIGGKLANDKLSSEKGTNWSIETKNKHGKCFLINYNPEKSLEFLSDYSPSIVELNPKESSIKTETGTLIKINNIKEKIKKEGWPLQKIENELSTFFGFLVPELEKKGKKFELFINGQSLKFSYRLPGSNIGLISKKFNYDYYGEKKQAIVNFRLSFVHDVKMIENHPLKNIDIISKVKICKFSLDNHDLVTKHTEKTLERKGEGSFVETGTIYELFNKLIGFISCDALSDVLDETGMPAKDLSHHYIRDDHPVTQPFYNEIYKVVIGWLVEYALLNKGDKVNIMDALAIEISSMLAEEFEDMDITDLFTSDFGEEEEEEEEEEKTRMKKLAEKVANKESNFDPEKKEKDKEEKDWKDLKKIKIKKSKYIKYSIIGFGEQDKYLMSKHDDTAGFCVLINSENPKFKSLSEESNPFSLSLHISEILIKEVMLYKNPILSTKEIEKKVSNFYEKRYSQVKEKTENNTIELTNKK